MPGIYSGTCAIRHLTFLTCSDIRQKCIVPIKVFLVTKIKPEYSDILYIYNIRTLSVNIKFICTSFRNRHNSEPSASFSGLFCNEYK